MYDKAIEYAKLIKKVYLMSVPNETKPKMSKSFSKDWKIVNYINTELDIGFFKQKTFVGVVAKSLLNPNEYTIIFRGSESILDFVIDFEFSLDDFDLIADGGKVEYGFLSLYKTLTFVNPQTGNSCNLKEYLKSITKNQRFFVIGHSSGAASATLHAAVLAHHNFTVEAYTFASPMVGDEHFVKKYNSLVEKSYRFVNKPDIVTKLPSNLLGYQHVQTLIEINSLDFPKLKNTISSFHSLDTYIYCLTKENK